MDIAFTLATLLLAVGCVMAATRPSRPAARRRLPPPANRPPDLSGWTSTSRPSGIPSGRVGLLGRWERRDLARALAVELVAPGADGEAWPAFAAAELAERSR